MIHPTHLEGRGGKPVSKWQPIETAPKDGTAVLLWMVHPNAKYAKDPVGEGYEAVVVSRWIDHNGGGWTWYGLCGLPTHWMPLPPAPIHEAIARTGGD